MNKFFKRLALLLAVLMIVSMMPVQLFADNSVTGEGQSNGTTQNKAVASYELNGKTISFEGKTIREVNTKMREYWEVDDAHGCSYNADKLPADGTGALTWTIYGTVGQGEYLNSGALILPALSGGYIHKNGTYQWKNITVVPGDKNATIVSNDTFDVNHIYVSNGANATTTFTGITLDGSLYVVPNGTVTFDGCVFKGMLRVPSGNGVVKVANCQFVGDADEDSTGKKNEYPFFFQAGGTLEFIGNTIAADTYKRGLNVGGLTELNATIENNTIGAVTAGYSAIQLSGKVTEAKIKGNEISLDGTNAFTLHESLISANKVTKVTVKGNTITGNGYLIYDDTDKAFTSENLKLTIGTNTVASTVDTTHGVKGSDKFGLSETVATVVKEALTPTYVAKVNGVDYASLAEAITKANGNGTVTLLTATTELVQALLDGQYGSIDGLTIELPAGDYGKLELGRATKYAGSNTEYFVGGFDSTDKNYEAFTNADGIREYKGQSTWTPNCFYRRALKNVTIKAADGATVTIEKISADAGQIYGKADAPKYDYVLDVEILDTNKSYWMALAWNNVTFEGINFKSSVNIESSSEKTLIDGLHFEKCNFNSGYTELAAANDANKASKGMGIRFVSWTKTTNNLRNLTVNKCTFEDCSEGVYTNPVYGVSVTNSRFNNINHNAVAIQDVDSAVNHGDVEISDNHFENVGNRIIRFNNVGDGTTITITGNTSVNSGKKDNGEIIKATTMPDSVNVNMTSNTWGDVNDKTAVLGNGFKPTSTAVATVGGVEYTTLAEAIAALNSTNHTLTLIDASAWDAATPVYWQAGTQSGYAAKLTDALTAAYKAKAGDITIVCRPGADVGAMTHGHVADNLTVYGNNAYISGGECDLEVDTYMYSRETGKQVATGGVYLDKAITITAYELDNLGVWGQRHTGSTINISLNDCDGKAIEGKANVQRVYISVKTGVNNITVVGCDFLTKATALYSNADGIITIDNCSFAGSQVPVNFNHKANGTQTVTVKNSTFTNCGDNGDWKQFAAPVRFVNSGSGTLTATVDNCTFAGTVGANGDILLGDGRNGEDSFNVSVTVVNTAAKVQIHQPGYYGADGSTTGTNCEETIVEESDTPTTFFTVAVAEVTFTDGTTKKYSDIAEALEAANAGDTVTLLADINTPEKTYEITKNLTIDLNGKTVIGSGYDGVFEVTGKKIKVVLNATNGGKVIAVENSGSAGKYAMAVWMCGADSTLTINGGEFIQNITSTNDKQMDMIYASAGTIIINSGSFTSGTPKWTLNINDSAYKNGTANIIVNGGTFTGYDPRNAENEGKGTSLVADGVGIDKNADGTFTAKSGMAAQIVDADGNSVAAYATLADAIAAAKSGATVTLLDNIDISTTGLTISAERTITLDLNGHTLKVANTDAGNIKVCGKLTLKDSTDTAKNGTGTGKIYTETPYIYGTQDKVMIATMSGGEFTMESGLIDAASFTTDNANVGHFAVSVQNDNGNATVTINGGHIKAGWYAIAGNGQNSSFEGNIIVNGGILESVADYAIYHPHAGTTTINGGVVFGAAGGVSINRGKLVVNGGTITSKGTGTTGNWGDGTGNQAAVAINVNAKYETTTVEIKGGTITAEKDAILLTNGRDGSIAISGGTFSSAVPEEYCAEGFIPTKNADGTYGVKEAMKGSKKNPYTLKELGKMTRAKYIAAQEALGGTMYVEIGNYSYDKNGVLGNGKRDDTTGQTEDRSVLNGYNSNGYLRENNDGANGKNIIFVGGSVTSGVTGYASIDNIGTSLLLAVPAYTNVTFEGTTFNNVMSFDYQLYTGPWSQLGELKFSGCTFNGLIVGAIAAQTLTFDGCEFKNYTNTTEENNSNPTWIRPAYGNWSKGDNEGQGSDFKSLTTINFTNNTVTSTRPVKFEYISQWDITSTVTATGNYFDITAQSNETPIKNVGLYLGAHTDANEFHLVAANNTKSENTAALYTIPSGKTSLPVDSTVKNTAGESIELTDALKWKATDAKKDKIVLKTVIAVASIGERRFATLEEAVAAVAKNGEEVTIKLLSNITAGGIDVAAGQNIVFDFDGHTYTLDGSMVGSTGTKTNGFRFLKGSTVVLKNGTLANGNGSPAKAMINSYATLKLVDFSVDARTTAVAETGSAYGYAALYISNGVTTVTGNGNYTTSDDNFVILIANVGDYTDGASLVFDENYTGTVSGKVSTGNKQNATVEIKNGKFDLKSIDVENTNTTVTISGGKFKNIEIAGKYLDNKAFDTEADADGYYAVMAHPIESFGVTVGEGLSLRLYVRDEYRNGKLLIKYVKPNGRDGETIEKELKINSVIENVNGTATIRYCARIFNITPQMADVVIKVQYVDETGVAIGSEKEVSILKYCQNYVKEDSPESVKIFISKLLEYCATAMDYRIVTNADEVYSGNTWQKRAEMLRKEKVSICGEANKEYKFENLGTYTNIGETFTTRGMEYDSVIKIFFAIDASKYNSNYKYYLNGNEISPIHYTKDDKDQYRFYFTIAPYEYHNSIRITIKNGEDDIGEYACSLDIILESFSKKSGNAELDALARLSVAAYEYCRSLADYPTSKDFNQ